MGTHRWQPEGPDALVLHAPTGRPVAWICRTAPTSVQGLWRWGYTGPALALPLVPPPSFDFVRLEVAQAEVEAWLAALHGPPSTSSSRPPRRWPFTQPQGAALGWAWTGRPIIDAWPHW